MLFEIERERNKAARDTKAAGKRSTGGRRRRCRASCAGGAAKWAPNLG